MRNRCKLSVTLTVCMFQGTEKEIATIEDGGFFGGK